MLRPLLIGLALVASAAPVSAGPFDTWFSRDKGATQAQSDGTVGDLVARIQRLEGQNRILTGQVQELQNRIRVTLDDFKRYRDDTEFRLQALEGGTGKPPPRRSQATPAPQAGEAVASAGAGGAQGAPPSSLGTLPGDDQTMMDDGGSQPSDLDGTEPQSDPAAPMDLGQVAGAAPAAPQAPARPRPSGLAPPGLPGVAVDTSAPPAPAGNQQVASLPGSAEEEYTADYRLIESRSYEAAELAFRKFLQSYPKDRRVPDALHWVGESLYQRQQYRDAAEQFLKVTTTYGTHRRAPSSMLKLGMSLAALGEKEAACATFQEVARKYPAASESVKNGVTRETQKNGC
jgi:tol-pal system protein YbgF